MDKSDIGEALRQYDQVQPKYEALADAMRVLLTQLLRQAALSVESVGGRAKEPSSLKKKLENPKYPSLNDVQDFCGLRIVTRHAEDVHLVADLIRDEFDVLEHVIHGAESPESFGYASQHLIVQLDSRRGELREWTEYSDLLVEVQVRSILQHAWASISHGLDYKSGSEAPAALRRQLFRIAALLETSDELFDEFRRTMMKTRDDYEASVTRQEWRSLPLNLDSLNAAQDEFPWSAIVQEAIDAGFRFDDPTSFWLRDLGSTHRSEEAARLVRVAQGCGLTTVGDLQLSAQHLLKDSQPIRQVAQKATEAGTAPYPVPYDVLTIYLIASSKSEKAFAAIADGDKHPTGHLAKVLQELILNSSH